MNDRQIQNNKHKNDPQPGDAWFERCSIGICVVVGTFRDRIVICQEKKDKGDGWTWDLDKLDMKTKEEFSDFVSYKASNMEGHTWCDVYPGAHMWVVTNDTK